MSSSRSQEEKNYALYVAARKNDVLNVYLNLADGAEVVHIEQNGAYSRKIKDQYYLTSRDFDIAGYDSISPYTAIDFALYYKNLEMFALLIQALQKTNHSPANYAYNIAASLGPSFLRALSQPGEVLQEIQENRKIKDRYEHPFLYTKVENIQFENKEQSSDLYKLNDMIARIYARAKKLFDEDSFFSIGKGKKARKILQCLISLHDYYKNVGTPFSLNGYLRHKNIDGISLEDILQEKRVPNPFTTFARSWNNLVMQVPGIESSYPTKKC